MTGMKITVAQVSALMCLGRKPGEWPLNDSGELEFCACAGSSISRPTVEKLVRDGLARWTEEPHRKIRYGRIGKGRYVTEWAAVITDDGRRVLAQIAWTRADAPDGVG
jgi:hypothetical protein